MNSEWRDMAAYVARLEREREELRAALEECVTSTGAACWQSREYADKRIRYIDRMARAALSSGEHTEGGR